MDRTELQPNEDITVEVMFDAAAVDTLDCSRHASKLILKYDGLERQETVNLEGIINRPGLTLDADAVRPQLPLPDFDTLSDHVRIRPRRTDAQERATVGKHNGVTCGVQLVSDSKQGSDTHVLLDDGVMVTGSLGPEYPPVFDVLPIMGTLHPGEKETAMVSYFAVPGSASECMALLHVTGGPCYQAINLRLSIAVYCFPADTALWKVRSDRI